LRRWRRKKRMGWIKEKFLQMSRRTRFFLWDSSILTNLGGSGSPLGPRYIVGGFV